MKGEKSKETGKRQKTGDNSSLKCAHNVHKSTCLMKNEFPEVYLCLYDIQERAGEVQVKLNRTRTINNCQ